MNTPQYHPECACQKAPLTQDDLTNMYAAGKYDEINAAHAAGRFQLNTDNTNTDQ